jgi:hypothetical protein
MSKRKLDELIDNQEPAIKLLQQLVNDAKVPCELLPPGPEREKALLYLQVMRNFHVRYTSGTRLAPTALSISSATISREDSSLSTAARSATTSALFTTGRPTVWNGNHWKEGSPISSLCS